MDPGTILEFPKGELASWPRTSIYQADRSIKARAIGGELGFFDSRRGSEYRCISRRRGAGLRCGTSCGPGEPAGGGIHRPV